ncbi:MAG TPA: hypothetical protein PKC69_02230 [Chitinophagaceae bacterium]|nr:hypothetical protein [Chitinophagaceae bacterium]
MLIITNLLSIFFDTSVYFFIILKTKDKHIHRGELLQSVVRKSTISITRLTRRMGISRGTFYNHKDDPNLSYDLLEQYGKALNYDFSGDVPGMHKYMLEEPVEPYGEPKTLEDAIRQRDYWKKEADRWKDKYIQALEQKK